MNGLEKSPLWAIPHGFAQHYIYTYDFVFLLFALKILHRKCSVRVVRVCVYTVYGLHFLLLLYILQFPLCQKNGRSNQCDIYNNNNINELRLCSSK